MSARNNRRKKFFENNPLCCFCGGNTKAEEEDHFPSRALFDDRKWPEGYVFPACSSCNRLSSKEENIIAFISRFNPEGDCQSVHFVKLTRSINEQYPGLLLRILPSNIERKNLSIKSNLDIPQGVARSEAPIVKLNEPEIIEAVKVFSQKLLMALYYKHIGEPLPLTGGICTEWYTNLQVDNDGLPSNIIGQLPSTPQLKRCLTSLKNQFDYHYGVTEYKTGLVCEIQFRQSFYIFGVVAKDSANFTSDHDVLSPFQNSS